MLKLIKNANLFSPTPHGIVHILVAGETIVYIGSKQPDLDVTLELSSINVTSTKPRVISL